MISSQPDFIKSIIHRIGYNSKKEMIEKLFIQSLKDSYKRIDKNIGHENEIRDRFRDDLYHDNRSILKTWIQNNVIFLDWENWNFTNEKSLARTDFSFKFSGMKFIIECKRLKRADNAYIAEGLERFISLKYAKGDEYAGMIGFVVAGNKDTIGQSLRKKINGLDHTLSIKQTIPEPFFNSIHRRKDMSQIELYHSFFDFTLSSSASE